jgi:hypothetical protein
MTDSLLEVSDFKEPLAVECTFDEVSHCFFDVQHSRGLCLGLRSFTSDSSNNNRSLYAAEQMNLRFTSRETAAAYMEKESVRIAPLGEPFLLIQAPDVLPSCDIIVTAARLEPFIEQKKSLSFYCSIQDNIHIIRLALYFFVEGDELPVRTIKDVLHTAVRKSRSSRRLGL